MLPARLKPSRFIIFIRRLKIRIIPNGIDPEEYRGVEVCEREEYLLKFVKRRLGVRETIVSMGRIHKRKVLIF